jgi:mannose-6-phosphate isomerase class I
MLKDDAKATLKTISLNSLMSRRVKVIHTVDFVIVYLYKGAVKLSLSNKTIETEKGDVLVIDTKNGAFNIEAIANEDSEIIVVRLVI